MEEREFRTENKLDFKFYKEFFRGIRGTTSSILKIIGILSIIVFIFNVLIRNYDILFKSIIILLLFGGISEVVTRKINKIRYNQMTLANKNLPIKNNVTINKDGIKIINPDSNNKTEYTFDSINSIVETKNMYILKMNYKVGMIINKNNLTGGTKEEFIEYILDKCSNIKKKKVYNYQKNTSFLYGYVISLILILILSIIMPFSYNKRMENYLETNGYQIADITSAYNNSNIKSVLKINKETNFERTYIYKFKSNNDAIQTFFFWINDESEIDVIKEGKVYKDGDKILLINGRYILYADESRLQDEITNLFETLNNYLY